MADYLPHFVCISCGAAVHSCATESAPDGSLMRARFDMPCHCVRPAVVLVWRVLDERSGMLLPSPPTIAGDVATLLIAPIIDTLTRRWAHNLVDVPEYWETDAIPGPTFDEVNEVRAEYRLPPLSPSDV